MKKKDKRIKTLPIRWYDDTDPASFDPDLMPRGIWRDTSERELSYLGEGQWCQAWRDCEDPIRVFLFVKECDHSKEVFQYTSESEHLPKVEYLGDYREFRVYETTFSETLTAKHRAAWDLIKSLEKTRSAIWGEVLAEENKRAADNGWNKGSLVNRGYCISQRLIETMEEGSEKEALANLSDSACNWGSCMTFEFSPRNCGVTKEGKIIFRDVIFSIELLQREDKEMADRTMARM